MREVLTLQIGQCGNQLGTDFWELMCAEHGIDLTGRVCDADLFHAGDYSVLFSEIATSVSSPSYSPHYRQHGHQAYTDFPSRLIPRALLIDSEPGTLHSIRGGPSGSLFSPDNVVYGHSGAGNNWAKGFYTEGNELIDTVLERVRKEVENCDHLQAFQLIHSLGGGTGSGLGALILTKLREEYPDRLQCTFSVVPSAKVSDSVVEPYNTTLAMSHLIEDASQCFTFDNEALYDLTLRVLKTTSTPTYSDLNGLVARAMAGATSSQRYHGTLNCDYRKLAVNLTPFPRLHFFMLSLAPLASHNTESYRSFNIQDVSNQLFDAKNFMCAADPRQGKYLTCGCLFRGGDTLSLLSIQDQMAQLINRNSSLFSEWIPSNIAVSLAVVPTTTSQQFSSTLIANNTAIQGVWRRVLDQFTAMFRRKAFMHWYTGEGMEEMEFIESEANLRDLITEYQQYQNMDSTWNEEHSFGDDQGDSNFG